MTAKNTYWITDGYGAKALIEGAAERDRWIPLGWSETSEPAPEDRVWLQHETHGGRQLFAAPAVPSWSVLGWQPCPPPEPVDLTRDSQYVDQPEATPPPAPVEIPQPRMATSPTQEK